MINLISVDAAVSILIHLAIKRSDDVAISIDCGFQKTYMSNYRSKLVRRFLDGIVFGGGFAIAFLSVCWLINLLIGSGKDEPLSYNDLKVIEPRGFSSSERMAARSYLELHNLPVDEQISKASMIALAEYEPADDGRMVAVIREFLKRSPGVEVYYDVGEPYPNASFEQEDGVNHGQGVVLMFTGSPASVQQSVSIHDGRIPSMGDMPIEVLREKCSTQDAEK